MYYKLRQALFYYKLMQVLLLRQLLQIRATVITKQISCGKIYYKFGLALQITVINTKWGITYHSTNGL